MLERLNNLFRRNVNPSPITDEAVYSEGYAYLDPLILWGANDYRNKIHKRMCMYGDSILNTLTMGWSITATAKTFKFYTSHETNGVEIMQEYRQWWESMNLNELLKALIPHFCMDGHVLLDLYMKEEMEGLGYNVYGTYECDKEHWDRDADNNILAYHMKYVPFPIASQGFGYGSSYMNAVDKDYKAGELLHLTRGDWNGGFGQSRVAPIWDAATKLRHGSAADFFRKDSRFIVAVPKGWKDKRIKSFADTMNAFLRGQRRAFYYKMEQSDDPSKTPLNLPTFSYTSLSTPAPKPTSQSEAGGQLLRDPEWARLLSGTRLTENYFLGNQSGAVTGSEVDLTRDFYTECEEFGLLEPVIKGIINWFASIGLIPMPPSNYVVKYWKDWEHIEKEAAMIETQMMMQQNKPDMARKQSRTERLILNSKFRENLKYEILYRYNELVESNWIDAIRYNLIMPMTPVASSWIKGVGAGEGELYMETHEGYKYAKPRAAAEDFYKEWTDSASKGGFYWDYLADRNPPWARIGAFPTELGELAPERYEAMAGEGKEFKMKGRPHEILGAGTTRAALTLLPLTAAYLGITEAEQPRFVTPPPTTTSITAPAVEQAQAQQWDWTNRPPTAGRPRTRGVKPAGKVMPTRKEQLEEVAIPGMGERVKAFGKQVDKAIDALAREPQQFKPQETVSREPQLFEKPQTFETREARKVREEGEAEQAKKTETLASIKKVEEYAHQKGEEYAQGRIADLQKKFFPKKKVQSAPKLNSQAYIKRLASQIGWGGMSNDTAQKIMKLVEYNDKFNIPRYNSFIVGNPMDFDVILRYPDNPKGEKACPNEWKKINSHEGDLVMYEDLGHNGERYNVGKYKYYWDEKEGKPIMYYNKEETYKMIQNVLTILGKNNSKILAKINKGENPDISTEYYCHTIKHNGTIFQMGFHNAHGDPEFERIAIVEDGNCGPPYCNFIEVEDIQEEDS